MNAVYPFAAVEANSPFALSSGFQYCIVAFVGAAALFFAIGFFCAMYFDAPSESEKRGLAADANARPAPHRWSETLPAEGSDWTDADGEGHSVRAVAWSSGRGVDVRCGKGGVYESASIAWEEFDELALVVAALRMRPGATPPPE